MCVGILSIIRVDIDLKDVFVLVIFTFMILPVICIVGLAWLDSAREVFG